MVELIEKDDMDENINYNKIINNTKLLIDKDIHKFLFFLLKKIFLKNKNEQFDRYLNEWINNINQNIIINKDKYINEEYSIKNFNNIIDFTKSQNYKYAGDIIEGILIIIFSFGFKIDKEQSINKYLFNNFGLIKDKNNYDLLK